MSISAIQMLDQKMGYNGITSSWMSKKQEEVYFSFPKCENNEQKFGFIKLENGEIVVSCRCEDTTCLEYEHCISKAHSKVINRVELSNQDETDGYYFLDKLETYELEYFGRPQNIIYEHETSNEENDSFEINDQFDYQATKYLQLNTKDDTRNEVINAPFNKKIFINAGPGTGKTYSIIERLKYLTDIEPDKVGRILILSFTNAAKKVIEQRIEDGIKSEKLPIATRNIIISTLDSLATHYLLTVRTDIRLDFSKANYNNNIKLFNETITNMSYVSKSKELFGNFSYLIVDEIQDTVNERAKMLQNILTIINCPWLIAGDKCQAIFDYDSENPKEGYSSVKLYQWLENFAKQKAYLYEIMGNKRQSKKLDLFTQIIRQKILSKDIDAFNFIMNELNNPKFEKKSVSSLIISLRFIPIKGNEEAILCRSNYEVAKISSMLHDKKITHSVLKGSNSEQFKPIISELFTSFNEQIMTRGKFNEIYNKNVTEKSILREELYEIFISISNNDSTNSDYSDDEINIDKVINKLSKKAEIPQRLFIEQNKNLTVSTIHKAKGREYDKVYIVVKQRRKNSIPDDPKVWYVATTRPKSDISLITRNHGNWSSAKFDNRYYGVEKSKNRSDGRIFNKDINDIIIGLPGDVDPLGFISNLEDKEYYIKNQNYIKNEIKIGDKIDIILVSEIFYIRHKGNIVGCLKSEIITEFNNCICSVSYPTITEITRLKNIYVNEKISIHYPYFDEKIPEPYRKTRIWMGFDIFGLGEFN
ncbi:AAA family ATPase [Treponema primitia]|uniref:UvrD-helicase domain-containing protein n=1 Tax=Treponema primitia TaxID=88058 RepID=UPI00397EB350